MLIMALMRNGHSRIFEYGHYMFTIAMMELEEHQKINTLDLAYAHRVSQSSQEDWQKFVQSQQKAFQKPAKKVKKEMTKEDHIAVIRRLKSLG